MVLGYDEHRPKAGNYSDFLKKFTAGLEIFGNKKISLMIYGSYVRPDFMPGRSDIDAVLVLPDNIVTDKKVFRQISRIIANAQTGNNIPLEITPVDLRIMSDGRFNSYDPSYERYFRNEGKILFGPDYRDEFKFEFPKLQDQASLTNNLWRSRRALLLSDWHKQKDYKKFLDGFDTTLNKVSRASKQIIGMTDGNLRLNRFSALEEISQMFPQVNVEPLKKIKHLYQNLNELDVIYRNPAKLTKVWKDSLTFFEEMIKVYLDANPRSQ